jgi:predicted nucleic acid-binding protein
MTGPVFVDTNVLVYARDPRDAAKQARAADWMAHLWRDRMGRTSAQVVSEYYVTVTRKLTPRVAPEEAWDDASALFAWRPQPVDEALLARAREVEQRFRLAWWDSMVVAAAQLQECVLLLTEDLQDGAVLGGVTVRSPFKLEVGEPAAAYAAGPAAKSRHPPRGRPKRSAGVSRAAQGK